MATVDPDECPSCHAAGGHPHTDYCALDPVEHDAHCTCELCQWAPLLNDDPTP